MRKQPENTVTKGKEVNMFLDSLTELAQLLTANHLTLATAESCTGGLLSSYLTSIPGASQWFDRALITYSNHAKKTLLKVSDTVLNNHGAVSEACAQAMVQGLLENSDACIGIAITGIAGPEGGTPTKPIGSVYFSLGLTKQATITYLSLFSGNRQEIRQQACEFAVAKLIYFIKTTLCAKN
jgi:PncC family amidohydrolase